MVRKTAEICFPVALFPEAETFHLGAGVAHWCEAVRRTLEIMVHQIHHVRPDNLVGIDKDDLLEIHGKEDIEKENLVCPDNSLFLLLRAEPRRPLVCNKLVFEVVGFSKMRDEFLWEKIDQLESQEIV